MRVTVPRQISGHRSGDCRFPRRRALEVIEQPDRVEEIGFDDFHIALRLCVRDRDDCSDLVGMMHDIGGDTGHVWFALRVFPDLAERPPEQLTPKEIVVAVADRFGEEIQYGELRTKCGFRREAAPFGPGAGGRHARQATAITSKSMPPERTKLVTSKSLPRFASISRHTPTGSKPTEARHAGGLRLVIQRWPLASARSPARAARRYSVGVCRSWRRKTRFMISLREKPAAAAILGIGQFVPANSSCASATRSRRNSTAGDRPKTWRKRCSRARRETGTWPSRSRTCNGPYACRRKKANAAASSRSSIANTSVECRAKTPSGATGIDVPATVSPARQRANSAAAS